MKILSLTLLKLLTFNLQIFYGSSMISKIKHKLFLYFLLFSSISLLAVITSVWFYNKRESLAKASGRLDEIYILSLKSFKLQQDFLNNEVIDEDYFKTDKSFILDQHDVIKNEINSKFKAIHENLKNTEIEASSILNRIQNELKSNDSIFKEIIYQYKIIGFQDFGVESEMRNHAHVLMKLNSGIKQVQI